jgi:hypothetical protein
MSEGNIATNALDELENVRKLLKIARQQFSRLYKRHGIYLTANDGMCFPQLNPDEDMFYEGGSYANRLRNHIEFCVAPQGIADAEDPKQVVLY